MLQAMGRKESERTELLNNKNKMYTSYFSYVFIHSWTFDCFHHLLTIANNAAMNVDVQLSLENRSFFLITCTYLFLKNFFFHSNMWKSRKNGKLYFRIPVSQLQQLSTGNLSLYFTYISIHSMYSGLFRSKSHTSCTFIC